MSSKKPLDSGVSPLAMWADQVKILVKGWLLEGQRTRRDRLERFDLGPNHKTWMELILRPNMTVAEVIEALLTLPPDVVLGYRIINGLTGETPSRDDRYEIRCPLLAVHGVPGNLILEAYDAASKRRIQARKPRARNHARRKDGPRKERKEARGRAGGRTKAKGKSGRR